MGNSYVCAIISALHSHFRGHFILFTLIRPIFLSAALFSAGLLQAESLDIMPESRSSVSLAIYNQNLALINTAYTLNLPAGQSELNFSTVSPLINFSSAVLHPLPESLTVLEQYFRPAMTPEELLSNSVGEMVSLVSTNPVSGEQQRERARVLSVSGGLILEIDGHYETSLAGRRIVYDSLPSGVLSPTLNIGVESSVDAQSELVLSYLSGGLSWNADYVAQLNANRDVLQLSAMATINNHSGVDFHDAQMELVAGSINQVQSHIAKRRTLNLTAKDAAPMAESTVQPVPLADLYMYALPGKVDLPTNSARQVRLFEARDVPVEQLYILGGQVNVYYSPNVPAQKLKVDSYIEFINEWSHQPGIPMPAGVVRIYAQPEAQPDKLRFIGEDRVGHTPAKGKARLRMGKAFDLGGIRKQLSYRRLPVEAPFHQHSEARIQVVLSNAKQEAVTVLIQESFSGEWSLVDGPTPVDSDAHGARWELTVPAGGEATLDLTIRVKR